MGAGCQQGAGVRVGRLRKYGAGAAAFYDLACVEHGQLLHMAGNQAQVVANQDEGHVVAGSQAVQQVEYLRLHGAIKRGGGFVCNQQIGFARQCAGYGYALALAA